MAGNGSVSVVRVAVVGAESSGKSTLTRMVAAALRGRGRTVGVVEEYAREFYRSHAYDPADEADVVAVAIGQARAERTAERRLRAVREATEEEGPRVLLCDTTALACRVWAEEALGEVPSAVAEADDPRRYLVHLVATPLPGWTPDPLRVVPDLAVRRRLFRRHVDLLRAAGARYAVVLGSGPDERLASALSGLDRAEAEAAVHGVGGGGGGRAGGRGGGRAGREDR